MQPVPTFDEARAALRAAVAAARRIKRLAALMPCCESQAERLEGAAFAMGLVMQFPPVTRETAAERARVADLGADLAEAREGLGRFRQWAHAELRALELGAGHDRQLLRGTAKARKALDACGSIADDALDELGAARGEGAGGDEQRQQGDGHQEHQGEQGGVSHGPNVMPRNALEVSR